MNQHVRAPLPVPRASVPAPRKLVYQWEPFSGLAREIVPLFQQHWEEIALNQDVIKLDPDYQRYLTLEVAGVLHVLAVRDGRTGRLVGYVFCMLGPHLHYASSNWALVDMFWLHPDYRSGWSGVRMFKLLEARMREYGAAVIMVTEKQHFAGTHRHGHNAGAIFEFLGYNPVETVYSKRLR